VVSLLPRKEEARGSQARTYNLADMSSNPSSAKATSDCHAKAVASFTFHHKREQCNQGRGEPFQPSDRSDASGRGRKRRPATSRAFSNMLWTSQNTRTGVTVR
jgi:hypothetical protein